MIANQKVQPNNYQQILTHSDAEFERLMQQAKFCDDLTEHVLRQAGIQPGMRVLDVGCGAGDVSFLAARLVGPHGQVIGVDKSPEATALAIQRAARAGLENVYFLTDNLLELTLDEPVDAIIGRLVLMYFADPAVLLRRLSRFLKQGGLVAFHEIDVTGAKALPSCELFELTTERMNQAFVRAGADVQAGLKLAQIFQEAGLPRPTMIQNARVESGPDSFVYVYIQQLARTLLPLMERVGIVTSAEVDIETLADRLRQESVTNRATLVPPPFIGAWTRRV